MKGKAEVKYTNEQLMNIISRDDLIELYENNSKKEIGKLLNLSTHYVEKLFSLYDIKTRDSAEVKKQWCLKKYGVDNISKLPQTIQNIQRTKEERYGDKNYHNIEKAKETNLNRYGCECSLGNKEVRNKAIETLFSRYGVTNSFNIPWVRELTESILTDNQEELDIRRRDTLLRKYGVTNISQIDGSRDKALEKSRRTCMDRYGVEYAILAIKPQFCGNRISKPNKLLYEELLKCGKRSFFEKAIGRYSYDLYFNDDSNIIVDINPSVTHNLEWSPYGDFSGVPYSYHIERAENAEKNGFRLLNIWDWTDVGDMINYLVKEPISIDDCTFQVENDNIVVTSSDNETIANISFTYQQSHNSYIAQYVEYRRIVGDLSGLLMFSMNSTTYKDVLWELDHNVPYRLPYEECNFLIVDFSPNIFYFNKKEKIIQDHKDDNCITVVDSGHTYYKFNSF